MRVDRATASALAIDAHARKLEVGPANGDDLRSLLSRTSQTLAQGDLAQGYALLAEVLAEMAQEDPTARGLILSSCAENLRGGADADLECLVLAVQLLSGA
jgi:hypothetical protein